MSHVFDTCNIICFSVRQLSSTWKNLASAVPHLGPTIKHSLKAVVVHNIILVLVSVRVVMKNKCIVSYCYSIMLYCCFSPGSNVGRPRAKWKARSISIIPYTNLEFQLSNQHVCVCVCVCVCLHACRHTCEHTCRCMCDNADARRLMYWHCSLWKT